MVDFLFKVLEGWPEILASAGIVIATILSFGKFFGDKFFTTFFQKKLDKFKHENDRELEELKSTLSSFQSGKTLLQQKEFQSLDLIWKSLTDYEMSLSNLCAFSLSTSMSSDLKASTYFSNYKQFSFSKDEADYIDSVLGEDKIKELTRLIWIKFLGSFILEEGNFRKSLGSLGIFLDQNIYSEIIIFQEKVSRFGNTTINFGPLEKGYDRNELIERYSSQIVPELATLREKIRARLENCL